MEAELFKLASCTAYDLSCPFPSLTIQEPRRHDQRFIEDPSNNIYIEFHLYVVRLGQELPNEKELYFYYSIFKSHDGNSRIPGSTYRAQGSSVPKMLGVYAESRYVRAGKLSSLHIRIPYAPVPILEPFICEIPKSLGTSPVAPCQRCELHLEGIISITAKDSKPWV